MLPQHASRLATVLNLDRREARLEAQILIARALEVERAWLIAHDRDVLTVAQLDAIESLIARRINGEPVAYILGEREFFGRTFCVTPDVLIPRPETELLVEAVLARLPKDQPAHVLDMGTGSGCIAISLALARPDCQITAVDISPYALAVATENAARFNAPVEFLLSDWFSGLPGRHFDIIVSNPPYVAQNDIHLERGDLPFEPSNALASGTDGLDAIRRIVAFASLHLQPDGALLLEHGWDQADAVRALLHSAGFQQTLMLHDLAGLPRISIGGEFSSHAHTNNASSNR